MSAPDLADRIEAAITRERWLRGMGRARRAVSEIAAQVAADYCADAIQEVIGRAEDELLTVDELADMLKVPTTTIYRWRYVGEGPPGYRIGRYVRFRRSEAERWLDDKIDADQREKARTTP